MVSTFTPNIQLEEPARGDDVGTWDTPVNNNMTLLDLVSGNQATITLNNSNVVLSAAQFQSKLLTFISTLTGSVTITFPTSFTKSYEIQHLCTGSSAFTITLKTTSGGQVVCAPPGETTEVFNDGANLKYKNLGRVGSYLDYAGGGLPNWVANCTVPPYLDCNGSTFSSAVYPQLVSIIGGTTLPDFRGRAPYYLNEGSGRLTTAGAGINGDTNFAAGGNNGVTLTTSMIPNLTCQGNNSITVNTAGGNVFPTTNSFSLFLINNSGAAVVAVSNGGSWSQTASLSAINTITVNSLGTSGGIVQATAPGIVSGIRMIRAA